MERAKISDILRDGRKVAYSNEYEFCKRVIGAVMSIAGSQFLLVDKEVEILGVMCKMCIEGGEFMKSRKVIEEMEKCGVEVVSSDTMRNYRSKIKKKGWIKGNQLNMDLRKAIEDGGMSVGIFLKRKD